MKKIITLTVLFSGCLAIAAIQAADRFAPADPNAAYQEMQKRAGDSGSLINSDYISASIAGKVQREVREGQATIPEQAVANSVVVQPGANTGDIYVNISVEGDTTVVGPGR